MARARRPTPNDPAPKKALTAQEIERGITRLEERITELKAFDIQTVRKGGTPELAALEVAIKDTLGRCFGEDTVAYRHFQGAANLDYYPLNSTHKCNAHPCINFVRRLPAQAFSRA